MSKRAELQPVLESEVSRWSSMTIEQLLERLRQPQDYELLYGSKKYQFEVVIVENTAEYLHVMISVDDGTLPASLVPLTQGIIRQK